MHITNCSRCGKAYEETTEEDANSPERQCPECRAVGLPSNVPSAKA